MQTTNYRRFLALLSALAVINVSARAEEYKDRTYGETKKDTTSLNRDSDRYTGDHYVRKDGKHGQNVQASKIIGKKVTNFQDDRLGKVDDLIIGDDFTVKYAIISAGGAMGVGGDKIAVPINDLQCSGDSIRLSATKEDLKAAAKSPSGEWLVVSGQDWTRDVTSYYGHPTTTTREQWRNRSSTDTSRFDREPVMTKDPADREPVRTQQGAGAQDLRDIQSGTIPQANANLSPADATLRRSVDDAIRQDYPATTAQAVTVSVENGEVTLRGTVANKTEKENIESRVKAISGVTQVNNKLTTRD